MCDCTVNRNAIIAGTGVALAATGLTIGALTVGGGDASTTPPKASTQSGTVSVLTGKPGAAGSILAVKIDNVRAARPAVNLSQADIVYAVRVEGGLSRLLAIYDGRHLPSVVGPVRSARETDLTLMPQFGRAGFAYSGATTSIIPKLNAGAWKNITPGQSGDFYRSGNRRAPHNEFLRTPPQLLNGVPKAKDIGLRFGALPAGGTPSSSTAATMPSASFQFVWTGSRWTVGMDGQRSPWSADNIIIQQVNVSTVRQSKSGAVPYTETVGSGRAEIYRDGRSFNVTWERGSKNSGTHYRMDGKDFKLKPGRTWVVLE